MKWSIFLLLASLTAFGQSKKIGNVQFNLIHQEDKPKETLNGQLEVYENNISNKGKRIKLNIEVVPAKYWVKKMLPCLLLWVALGKRQLI